METTWWMRPTTYCGARRPTRYRPIFGTKWLRWALLMPADYTAWRARFGNFEPPAGSGSGLGSGSVPEPGSVWLVLIAGSAIWGLRKRNALVR